MRNTFGTFLVVLLMLTNISWSQSKTAFGIHANLSVPTGSTSDKYSVGYGAGALVSIPTSSPTISIAAAADFLNFSGKTTTETEVISLPGYYSSTTTTTMYKDLQVVSLYAGPKFGHQDGAYFFPSISANFANETRFGFYLAAGMIFPSQSVKLHIGAKYGILNLIGKTDDEDSAGGIGFFAGVVF